jgi:hypothetical protein
MILSVPITSTIKIVCENVDSLHPVAVLMSGSLEAPKPKPAAASTPSPAAG